MNMFRHPWIIGLILFAIVLVAYNSRAIAGGEDSTRLFRIPKRER